MKVLPVFFKTNAQGAYAPAFAAASTQIREKPENFHGKYLDRHDVLKKQNEMALDEGLQDQLWGFTENLLKDLGVDGVIS